MNKAEGSGVDPDDEALFLSGERRLPFFDGSLVCVLLGPLVCFVRS